MLSSSLYESQSPRNEARQQQPEKKVAPPKRRNKFIIFRDVNNTQKLSS
jgi:hypothetical protein